MAGMDDGVYQLPVPRAVLGDAGRVRSSATSPRAAGDGANPFEREPERVLRDVRDGYVTIEGAARDYGVVVTGDPEQDPEGIGVDLEATERLRSAR